MLSHELEIREMMLRLSGEKISMNEIGEAEKDDLYSKERLLFVLRLLCFGIKGLAYCPVLGTFN